jgi:tyrosinase
METYYKRVQKILRAAGKSVAADHHGGNGPFWEKTLPEFKDLAFYGQQLIADPGPDRGASSALIKALRGDAPFDGTMFSPMPLGRQRVGDRDIDFIQTWIDEGLPDAEIVFDRAPPSTG